MTVLWNKKEYQPDQVVEKIESARKPTGENKKVEFEGWGFHEYAAVVYSMLDFSPDIPEIDGRAIVSKAIFSAGEKGVITVNSLLAEINRLENEYQSLPIQNYVLASSISIDQSWGLRKIQVGKVSIIFRKSLPIKYQKEIDALLNDAEQSLFAQLPRKYLGVSVYVKAKSIHHAADQALEALDFTRGIWNWILNRRHFIRMSSGKPQPVNSIILGPIHTLHEPNGKLATTYTWWYEPSYLGEVSLFAPKPNEVEIINKSFNYVKKSFKSHKYPQIIHNAMVRYTRALDERDWTVAFNKLWGVLELLTDTGKASYDITVKRTAFLYEEHDYHLQVLQHLKRYRNSFVHLDKGNSQIETYLYQLKNYVEALIHFHIVNKFGFRTIQEAAEFLSLSHEEDVLKSQETEFKEQIKKRNLARKFRGLK
jgi:hypothetical protein